MIRLLKYLLLGILVAGIVHAESEVFRVATLNCNWYFLYGQRTGAVKNAPIPASPDEFNAKRKNLNTLVQGVDVLFLQELGGYGELQSILPEMVPAYTIGGDTYTGQQVGIKVTKRWKLLGEGRVPVLDKVISKHLYAAVQTQTGKTIHLLCVHLIRPTPSQKEKNALQTKAVLDWVEAMRKARPDDAIILGGDFNCPDIEAGSGIDVGGKMGGIPSTHRSGLLLDHLIAYGIDIQTAYVKKAPLPDHPNDESLRQWTDHYALWAELSLGK